MRASKPSIFEIEEEWIPLDDCGSFTDHVGPVYRTRTIPSAEEPFRIGFQVLAYHCNPSGVCHGGMIASLLDIALGRGSVVTLDRPGSTPTISMSMDFLAPARVGEWLESRSKLLHHTHRMSFMQCVLVGPNGPVARGSGVFKIAKPKLALSAATAAYSGET